MIDRLHSDVHRDELYNYFLHLFVFLVISEKHTCIPNLGLVYAEFRSDFPIFKLNLIVKNLEV